MTRWLLIVVSSPMDPSIQAALSRGGVPADFPGDFVVLGAARRRLPVARSDAVASVPRMVAEAVVSAGIMAVPAQRLSISMATLMLARDMYNELADEARGTGADKFVISSVVLRTVTDRIRAMYAAKPDEDEDDDDEDEDEDDDDDDDERMPV